MPKDFSNQNLQGKSFKGQDLTGANFSGANLTGACLENWLIDSTTLLDNAHAENTMNDAGSKTVTIGDIDNRGGVFNLAEIMKDVSNSINQLPDLEDSEQKGLKELLIQFQTLILQDIQRSSPLSVKAFPCTTKLKAINDFAFASKSTHLRWSKKKY
jgi:uncharacterized protein YjbI with pentapeptide repeats